MTATIVHFEIPADNIERANKFYGSLFGWKIEKVPEMDYWMFRTGAGNGEQVMGGGIMQRHYPQEPIQSISVSTRWPNIPKKSRVLEAR
jgi:predicted enzyme related to lactoylglutathione lyase